MSMDKNVNRYLQQAKNNGYATGHFNFATADVLRGIVEASKDAGANMVMVGTSEGESDFFGIKESVALVKVMRECYGFPVFLNTDHFKSFERCKEAIDAGYDSVLFDGSKLPFIENVELAKKVVDYAKSVNPNISVEGEIGYLRGSSMVQDKVEISVDDYTKPEEARDFVEKTGVDRLAVVFGNIHGITTEQEIKLDIDHFKKIVDAVPNVFYVLHGASGLGEQDVKDAIKAGVTNVHYNTELRIAYKEGIQKVFQDNPNETTPYKYLSPAVEGVKKVVASKIKLFMD
jgi:fructose-bisphosphate aldolase, class II